jgi:hypothetical protein
VYRILFAAISNTSIANHEVSTKAGQLHMNRHIRVGDGITSPAFTESRGLVVFSRQGNTYEAFVL